MNSSLNPFIAIGLVFAISFLIFVFMGRLGPAFKAAKSKLKSYSCGEEIPGDVDKEAYGFFYVAFIFTVLHVGVLLLATVPGTPSALIGLSVIASITLTSFALLKGGDADV